MIRLLIYVLLALVVTRSVAGATLPDGTPCQVVNHRVVDGDLEVYLPYGSAGDWVSPAGYLVFKGVVVGVELAGGRRLCLAQGGAA